MRIRCRCDDCRHWDEEGGDYIGEGGCTLDEISIDMGLTPSGFYPICEDYEEK